LFLRACVADKKVLWSAGAGIAVFLAAAYIDHNVARHWGTAAFYLIPALMGALAGAAWGISKNIIEAHNRRSEEFFLNLIEVLAAVIEERDQYTYGHSRRVTVLALQLGISLGLDMERMRQLRLAAILHDIGKVGIPDAVLLKPEKLTAAELALIREHPAKGGRILRQLEDARLAPVIFAVEHHHERYDGSGYPGGLAGEAIPFLARIIAIADSFDAMTSDRPYRPGMDTNAALAEIERGAGAQFDPELAKRFTGLFRQRGQSGQCPALGSCPLFPLIGEPDISKAYEMQYCRGNFAACARYAAGERGKTPPPELLPDGRRLERLRNTSQVRAASAGEKYGKWEG